MSFGGLISSPRGNSDSMGARILAEMLPHGHNMPSGAISQFPLSLSIVMPFFIFYFYF